MEDYAIHEADEGLQPHKPYAHLKPIPVPMPRTTCTGLHMDRPHVTSVFPRPPAVCDISLPQIPPQEVAWQWWGMGEGMGEGEEREMMWSCEVSQSSQVASHDVEGPAIYKFELLYNIGVLQVQSHIANHMAACMRSQVPGSIVAYPARFRNDGLPVSLLFCARAETVVCFGAGRAQRCGVRIAVSVLWVSTWLEDKL